MLTLDPKDLSVAALQGYLSHAVAPRPVAFVSTIDKQGKVNLSPFSFFNLFSTSPPIAIFSPARSGKTNATKHTHQNVLEVPEAVINLVSYDMVQQMSLSSTEYEKGVNEFVKAGFTQLASEKVKPPRVKESPVQLECKVKEVIEMGQDPGAGNLVICEVILMHIADQVLNENKFIDQHKMDLVGRLGANWYVRASGDALFEVAKPSKPHGMGVDALPDPIKKSKILTGNNLGQLGNVEKIPTTDSVKEYKENHLNGLKDRDAYHQRAKELLDQGKLEEGWKALLAAELN